MEAPSSPQPSGPAGADPDDRTASRSVLVHDRRIRPGTWPHLGPLAEVVRRAISLLGLERAVVEVTLVDPDEMRRLNAVHMGADGATDVLAFPLDGPDLLRTGAGEPRRVGLVDAGDGLRPTHGWHVPPGPPGLLGDVVVCPDVAAEQATAAGRAPDDEVSLLLVHGLLHLLGHDHADADDRRVMFALTDLLLEHCRGQVAT